MVIPRSLAYVQPTNFLKKSDVSSSWVFLFLIISYPLYQLCHLHKLKVNFKAQQVQSTILPKMLYMQEVIIKVPFIK